jgi:hypothetical protein
MQIQKIGLEVAIIIALMIQYADASRAVATLGPARRLIICSAMKSFWMSAVTGSEGYGFLVKMRSDLSRHPCRRGPDDCGHDISAIHAALSEVAHVTSVVNISIVLPAYMLIAM